MWVDAELANYVAQELHFPGVKQVALLEKERTTLATGAVSKEHWYLVTSLAPEQCDPKGLLRLFRDHWSIENSQHHVKDRSWGEDHHTLRRPGLGEVFATLINISLNALRLPGWFPDKLSMPRRAKNCAFNPEDAINWLSRPY